MADGRGQRCLAIGVLATSVAAAVSYGRHSSVTSGMLVGGAWNLINLWCLTRALGVWLASHPSRWRSALWFIVKFPLLYGLALGLLMTPGLSLGGFIVGFSATLGAALLASIAYLQSRLHSASFSHGR